MRDTQSWQIDRNTLPDSCPTNGHPPEFWENLGRAVAIFGLLEAMLGRAIFALSATHEHEADQIDEAFKKWESKLERALKDQLGSLIKSFENEVRAHSECKIENFDKLVCDLNKAREWRNVLCHATWQIADQDGGSVPLFINNRLEKFETRVDITLLKQIQVETTQLCCDVIDPVTKMGWQFPGLGGPGKKMI